MSFSHRDGYLTISPTSGPNRGKPFRILTATKVSFDPGGKTSYMKGFEQTPIAIIRGSAEPKLDIDLSSGAEGWRVVQWVGYLGGNSFTVAHVFRRPGVLITPSFSFVGCELENGGGYDSDEGNGVANKLAIKMKDVLFNKVSIYAKRYSQ